MQTGQIVLTQMDRVVFGKATKDAIAEEAERLGAKRVFLLVSSTLHQHTREITAISRALGNKFAGVHSHMPAHSPRYAVVECANHAREAKADLLVTIGGGSVTDGGKAVTLCLEHDITDTADLEPFRTVVKDGKRESPSYQAPSMAQIAVPTTLSGGEFNARAGITDTTIGLKQSYVHPALIPTSVILDPAITVHTPEWLWLSTGIRALDHAVETLCSIDANDFTNGTALQALRLLASALPAVHRDPSDLDARLRCLMGTWLSMVGIVSGTRLGASHAIGHILGGTAGVPHGYTSCVMLPYVLRFNAEVNGAAQQEIATAMGRPDADPADVVHRFIEDLGMPRTLAAVGINRSQLPQLAEHCMLDDWTFSNPKPISSPEQVMDLLTEALGEDETPAHD